MYNLSEFVEYTDQHLNDNDAVLIWSRETGYMFMNKSEVGDRKIVACEK